MQSSNNKYGEQDHEELNGIQREINQITNESLESTRRTLGLMVEADDIGEKTMVMLDEQDEKLTEIEGRLDNVHAGMDKAEKHLTNLQKFGGLFVLPWQRVSGKHRLVTNGSATQSSEKSSPTIAAPKVHKAYEKETPTSGYITRITNDPREDEMNNNLESFSSLLGNLKEKGIRMGDAIEKQNEKLGRIANKNEAGVERVADATKQTQNILKK